MTDDEKILKNNAEDLNQHPAGSSEKPKRKAPVFVYLAILFAAAFVMILLAYFIQQRNNELEMDSIYNSLAPFQSVEELIAANQNLQTQIDSLQEQLNETQQLYESAQDQLETANAELETAQGQTDELTQLLSLERAMATEDYDGAANLCIALQDKEFSVSDGGTLSPAERVQQIGEALIDLGYLWRDENNVLRLYSDNPNMGGTPGEEEPNPNMAGGSGEEE